MKAIGSCFTVNFWTVAYRRTYASKSKLPNVKQPYLKQSKANSKTNPLESIKPHERSGILSAVEKDDSGFPSYLILKETSPLLRFVTN